MPLPTPGKINVNRHAVVKLALYGPQERVDMLYAETGRTLKRLGLKPNGTPLKLPKGEGGMPNVHDLVRWLDSLTAGKREVKFLQRLHATLARRAKPKNVR